MSLQFHFSFEPDWRTAPLAFWVHVPVSGQKPEYVPPAPAAVPHQGFAFLHVDAAGIDLRFSSLAQLDHFIETLATTPLPTSLRLSRNSGLAAGPNGHWLSRLPAGLKTTKARARLVGKLRGVRAQLAASGAAWHDCPRVFAAVSGKAGRPA